LGVIRHEVERKGALRFNVLSGNYLRHHKEAAGAGRLMIELDRIAERWYGKGRYSW
jgi:hypothetical protein